MKERPILFSAPMVRALLDGSKTQTRRVCKQQPYSNGYHWNGTDIDCHNDYLPPSAMLMDFGGKMLGSTSNLEGWESECPYGQPGDQLWVREAWHVGKPHDKTRPRDILGPLLADGKGVTVMYDAGGWRSLGPGGREEPTYPDDTPMPDWAGKGRPSIHMPRALSRILLEIVSVRVERLNDCSASDAIAEGIRRIKDGFERWHPCPTDVAHEGLTRDPILSYRGLWESINGAGSWDVNPWVWVVEFKRVLP